MPTYTFYVYSSSVLSFNGTTGTFDFDAGYQHSADRFRIDVTDDDTLMNAGGDANQTATIYDMDGNVVDSGNIFIPSYASINVGGSTEFLDRIEVNGTLYGYVSTVPLSPGTSYPFYLDDTFEENHTYYQTFSVPCFGPDTLIDTVQGPRLIGSLQVGDKVLTYDNGYQPVLWTGSQRVSELRARLSHKLRPIVVPGTIRGVDPPRQPLTLSRQHRVMIDDPVAEFMTGERQVLVAALHFAPPKVPATDIIWHHILLPRHEIVRANGVWVESLFAGDALSDITAHHQEQQIEQALTGRRHRGTARPCLRNFEARVLLTRLSRLSRFSAQDDCSKKRVA